MIDLGKARERLRADAKPPAHGVGVLRSLELAEDLRSRLAAPGVSRAELARLHGVTRARVTQLLALLRLPREVLEWIKSDGCRDPELSERRLRPLLPLPRAQQLAEVRGMFRSFRHGRRARA